MTEPRWPRQEQAAIAKNGDPLPDHVRCVVGASAQLRVPMRDVIDLRRTAAILRGLANRMEALSTTRDPSPTIMLTVWAEFRTAQAQLQSRPKSR
jgi:CelD/BcsL family acetyltransferase involved in cellulose biosynthesis